MEIRIRNQKSKRGAYLKEKKDPIKRLNLYDANIFL